MCYVGYISMLHIYLYFTQSNACSILIRHILRYANILIDFLSYICMNATLMRADFRLYHRIRFATYQEELRRQTHSYHFAQRRLALHARR